jgi:hypothetical protein
MTDVTAAKTTTRDAFLRFALRLDAVITGGLGLVGAAIAPHITSLSGTTTGTEYAVIAFFIPSAPDTIARLVFGLAVFGVSLLPSVRRQGTWVIVGNVAWAVAAIAVALAGVWPLTTTGVVLILGSAVITMVMASLEYVGLRRIKG